MKHSDSVSGRFLIPGLLAIGLLALIFLPNLSSGFGSISFRDVLFTSFIGDSQFYLLLALAGVELALVSSLLLEDDRSVLRRRLVVSGTVIGLIYPLGLLIEGASISDFDFGLFIYSLALIVAAVIETGVDIIESARSLTIPSGNTTAWKNAAAVDWAIVKEHSHVFMEPDLDSDIIATLTTGAHVRIEYVNVSNQGESWAAVLSDSGQRRGYVVAQSVEPER